MNSICCIMIASAICLCLLSIVVQSIGCVHLSKILQNEERLIKMCASVNNTNKDNHTYYTEGYVKELSIDHTATKILKIEPTPSFLVEDGASKKILFASRESAVKPGVTKAVLYELNAQEGYSCGVDGSVLLQMKLNHTKVRFEFNSNLETIEEVTVI